VKRYDRIYYYQYIQLNVTFDVDFETGRACYVGAVSTVN
jgi:hypothetical protein